MFDWNEFRKDIESADATNKDLSTQINASDFLFDLKLLLKDNYYGKISKMGDFITIEFENGQKFKITVKECK